MVRLLVILQNAYGVRKGFKPSLKYEGFRKSRTGSRLQKILPDGVDVFIVNASSEIGTTSRSNLPADTDYVQKEIDRTQPNIILACGKNAASVITIIMPSAPVVIMPHPTSRTLTNETLSDVQQRLRMMCTAIRNEYETNHP